MKNDALDNLLAELEATADEFWNISRDNAVFLSLLLRTMNARRVLEIGTSNGYSALWFARALQENKHAEAEVVAIEHDAGRAALARENARRAGLSHIIRVVEGDALKLIGQQTGLFDFVFLDAEKSQYADYLRLALPLTRPNGLLIGDDTVSLAAEMPEYLALAFDHPALESVAVPIDDGVVISRVREK